MNLPGKVGRKCSVIGYALAQKKYLDLTKMKKAKSH